MSGKEAEKLIGKPKKISPFEYEKAVIKQDIKIWAVCREYWERHNDKKKEKYCKNKLARLMRELEMLEKTGG